MGVPSLCTKDQIHSLTDKRVFVSCFPNVVICLKNSDYLRSEVFLCTMLALCGWPTNPCNGESSGDGQGQYALETQG